MRGAGTATATAVAGAELGRRQPRQWRETRHVLSARVRPRPCENSKRAGFRVSLYPSRTASKSVRGDLVNRVRRFARSKWVFTQPRPGTVAPANASKSTQVRRVSPVHGGCECLTDVKRRINDASEPRHREFNPPCVRAASRSPF